MSAPLGNQFWKLRNKHGRDRLFATPELLWEAACEYFQWCEDNPLLAAEQRKGTIVVPKGYDGEIPDSMVEIPKMRAFTMQGLCIYLDCNTQYFRDFKKSLNPAEKEIDKDFSLIVTRIEEIIYNQKFTGAAAGFLNHNIIARDLGLRDNQDVTTDGDKIAFSVTLKI